MQLVNSLDRILDVWILDGYVDNEKHNKISIKRNICFNLESENYNSLHHSFLSENVFEAFDARFNLHHMRRDCQ